MHGSPAVIQAQDPHEPSGRSRPLYRASRDNGPAPFDACGYQKQHHGQDVGNDDASDLCVVAAHTPGDREERHRADKPRDQGDGPEFRAEGGHDEQHAEQAEEHCPVLQQDPDVGIVGCYSVQARELARPQGTGQRQEVNDPR